MCGLQNLYHEDRRPFHLVNFLTAHDRLTFLNLMSYNHNHNGHYGGRFRIPLRTFLLVCLLRDFTWLGKCMYDELLKTSVQVARAQLVHCAPREEEPTTRITVYEKYFCQCKLGTGKAADGSYQNARWEPTAQASHVVRNGEL